MGTHSLLGGAEALTGQFHLLLDPLGPEQGFRLLLGLDRVLGARLVVATAPRIGSLGIVTTGDNTAQTGLAGMELQLLTVGGKSPMVRVSSDGPIMGHNRPR